MHDIHAGTQMDRIFANPPFNQKKWGADRVKDDPRWKYGLPPDGNANYAWIQHMISHLKPRGRIGLVLANGALTSATGGEDKIRQAIIEDDLVEGIVSLPPQLFYSVTIPVTLWFFNRAKDQPGKTLFINATSLGHMVDRTHRTFSDEDIAKIASAFEAFRSGKFRKEEGFAAVAATEEIAEKKFKLTPGLYAGGKVEEEAYAPLLHSLASQGLDVMLVSMPARLAILDTDAADDVLSQYDYDHWYIGGHSLGGACADIYASGNTEKFDGIILLGAYATKPLGDMRALYIYGSEDHVMDMEDYLENRTSVGTDAEAFVIEGGNHAQFGSYGTQKGDGEASITGEEQVAITVDLIVSFVQAGQQ
jgi:hypothetical protein